MFRKWIFNLRNVISIGLLSFWILNFGSVGLCRSRSWGRRVTLTRRSSTRAWLNLWTLWTRLCTLEECPSWLTTARPQQDWDQGNGHRGSTTTWPNKLWWLWTTVQQSTETWSATSSLTQSMVLSRSAHSSGLRSISLCLRTQTLFDLSCVSLATEWREGLKF